MLSLVFVLLLALAGCKTVAKGDYFEAQIAEAYQQQGKTVQVDCPEAIALGRVEANTFRCQLAGGGDRVTVDVVIDDKLNLKWSPVAGTYQSGGPPGTPPAPPDPDGDPWN